MQWILLGMLLILTYGIYYFEGKDVASPTFITAVVFSVSSFFFAINANRWNRELEFQTILIIIGAVLVFFVGGRIRVIWSTNREIEYSGNVYYNLPKWVLLTFFGFNLGVSLLIYIRMSQILANVGTSQYALMALRTALNSGGYSWGMGISVLRESSYAIGYICISVFLINVIPDFKKNFRRNVMLLFPVIPMVFAMIMSTGRTGIIRVFGVIYVVGIVTYKRNYKIKLFKFVKLSFVLFSLLLVVFWQLGSLTGKSQIFSAFDTISIYVGSSIGTFNEYLKEPWSYTDAFGGETLYGMRSLLRILFNDVESTSITLPFCYVKNGHNSNVYTALRRYVNDYTVIGMFIIQFLKGMFFNSWYKSIKKSGNAGLSLILFAYFMFDIFMQSIEENFLRELLTLPQIFIIIVFFLVYKVFVRPYRRNCYVQ